MPSIRIIAAGTALMIGVGGAAAQTATEPAPGKPLQILQIVERNKTPTAKSVVKKRHVRKAAVKRPHTIKKTAHRSKPKATAVASVAPEPAPAAAALPTAAAPVTADPNMIDVSGQSVQIVPADEVNDMDRAATTPPVDGAANLPPAATTAGTRQIAALADAGKPATMSEADVTDSFSQSAAPTADPRSSWLAEALAALGGALAAASAAWFLIGSAPRHRYG